MGKIIFRTKTAASAVIVALLCIAYSCQAKEAGQSTLITEDLAAGHPEWRIYGDTIVKDFSITAGRKNEYRVPMRLTWVNAVDTVTTYGGGDPDMYFIAFYKLERMGGSDRVKITGVRPLPDEGGNMDDKDGVYKWWARVDIFGNIEAPRYRWTNFHIGHFDALGNYIESLQSPKE